MLTAIAFLVINCAGYLLALFRGPGWALLVYANVYFNTPESSVNWWAGYLPISRWSFLSTVVIVVSLAVHGKLFLRTKLHAIKEAVALLLLSFLITYSHAVNQQESLRHAKMLLSYCVIMYLIVKVLESEADIRRLYFGLIVLVTGLSVDAYMHGRRIHGRLERGGTSDAFGANELALLIAGVLPLAIPLVARGKWYERAVCFLSLPFVVNAFILCNSRGAFLALVGSFIVAFLLFAEGRMRRIALAVAVLAVPLFVSLADPEFIRRLSTLVSIGGGADTETDPNALSSGRMEIWKYGIAMVKDHPLGAGLNGFKELARFYMPAEILTFDPARGYGARAAHNSYLQVLVEQGVVGLAFFMGMVIHTLVLLRRAKVQAFDESRGSLFAQYNVFGLSISFFSILLGGMFNSRVYYEFFWWQIAFCLAAYSLSEKQTRGSEQASRSLRDEDGVD